MMKASDNELITRVENGAPMGEMLRSNFWFPATPSSKLLADKAPVRVRLLGEPFVAFRSTDGRVGFFNEHCPHRGASLALARNEDNALRCIFHGWKYGVDGTVLEVPTEPHNKTDFCRRVPIKSYPAREAAGIVWVWLGKGAPGRFPEFEFTTVPDEQVYSVCQNVPYNWVQDVEGGLDSAHVSILHSYWLKRISIPLAGLDTAPTYDFHPQPSGYRYAAIRKLPNGDAYIRVNQFVMPWFAFICPEETPEGDRLVIITTPNDDLNSTHWMVRYNRVRPLKPSYANPAEDRGNWPPLPPGGPADNWGQDREAMAAGHFTGFNHVNTEDFAVAASQGRIVDRSQEYLNAGDRAVVMFRRQLLTTVREFMEQKPLSLVDHVQIEYRQIKADALVIPQTQSWRESIPA